MKYEVVIGIEIHTQVASNTKAYCSCEVSPKSFENTKVCEVCSGQPGTLPKVNKRSIELALRAALATNCKINQTSFFDRKNYFYPDLPKGYQITQFVTPIAEDGILEIDVEGEKKKVSVTRVQLEEDTGKSDHDGDRSYINLNRAGTQLIEIVSGPDMRSGKEASAYLKSLHAILVYLGVTKGNMQEGNFRADVNLSLREWGAKEFGTRSEVKNLNSFKNVEKSIEYEIKRQSQLLDAGEKVRQQTLLFNADNNETYVLREKSNEDDYRYFPEPDLGALVLKNEEIKTIQENLPELPQVKKDRFINDFEMSAYDAGVLTSDRELAEFFELTLTHYKGKAKKVVNWVTGELLRYLNESNSHISKSPVKAQSLAELLKIVDDGKLSVTQAKDVFLKMYDEKKEAAEIIKSMGIEQISDSSAIEQIAKEVIEGHPDEVQAYKAGKDRLLGFFVGQIMKKTQGKANPKMASDLVKKIIEE